MKQFTISSPKPEAVGKKKPYLMYLVDCRILYVKISLDKWGFCCRRLKLRLKDKVCTVHLHEIIMISLLIEDSRTRNAHICVCVSSRLYLYLLFIHKTRLLILNFLVLCSSKQRTTKSVGKVTKNWKSQDITKIYDATKVKTH